MPDVAVDILPLLELLSIKMETITADMHSAGEAIRILCTGPDLQGSLLEQRSVFQRDHDAFRRQTLLEPRGHRDLWGAYLRQETELVETGEADIGVIFLSNSGYPTMCGHAVIALGRFLVDLDDPTIFRREKLLYDERDESVVVRLHAPCGVISVKVWTLDNGKRSDPNRSVSFYSVPSFVTGMDIRVPIPEDLRWPELGGRNEVKIDMSYGGAFFCIVPDTELGFQPNLENANRTALETAARGLKTAITLNPDLRYLYAHPKVERLSTFYGVMIVDSKPSCAEEPAHDTQRCETGVCIFANGQVDRSPCGAGVVARVMLAYIKNQRSTVPWIYHSLVSNAFGSFSGAGSFVGRPMLQEEPVKLRNGQHVDAITIKVRGYAHYLGANYLCLENGDEIGRQGFSMYHGETFVKPLLRRQRPPV